MILWIWTFIPAIFAFGRQGNRFVKEYVAVHDEPKSDYRCRGYVLINDLKLLLCENKRYNYSSGDLTVSVSVEAGLNDEPEGFSGVPTYVMWSVFRNTNLTKMTDYDRTKSDECSIRDYSTTFDFYQNATSGKDKLYNWRAESVEDQQGSARSPSKPDGSHDAPNPNLHECLSGLSQLGERLLAE
uniref:Secreted protein n=1 Tax=Romanomermis culicivorax TaxID=13658 RepID=A0A915JWZ0_ROMCU